MHSRVRIRATALVGAALLSLVAAVGVAAPAHAAGSITVDSDLGGNVADPDYATGITVTGSGFQSIRNGFGGVYVLFGWVSDGSWRPSQGGHAGTDYRYVPDSEAKDNAGFQRFVAFPGSDTESAAQAILTDDGSFTLAMTIPGAKFTAHDRDGNLSEVDCLRTTCGIITIGAHGVSNANNETFTPIEFRAPEGAADAAATPGATARATTPAATASAAPVAAGKGARVGLAKQRVAAGSALVFTAQGFTPGEQVVADLDNGVSAVGPLLSGRTGEVAGTLTVPVDLRDGTHVLRLRGAASGQVAESEVTVSGGSASLVPTEDAAVQPVAPWVWIVLLGAVAVALVLVVLSIVLAIVRAAKRRRRRRAQRGEAAAAATSTSSEGSSVYQDASAADAPTRPLELGAVR